MDDVIRASIINEQKMTKPYQNLCYQKVMANQSCNTPFPLYINEKFVHFLSFLLSPASVPCAQELVDIENSNFNKQGSVVIESHPSY